MMFGKRYGPTIPMRTVHWDITVTGTLSDLGVIIADEGSELVETSEDFFEGRWDWNTIRDGGVIGELSGIPWTITIDPRLYDNLDAVRVFDSSGAYIDLNLNTDASGTIRFTAIPEPSALVIFAGVLGTALIGYSWRRRRVSAVEGETR